MNTEPKKIRDTSRFGKTSTSTNGPHLKQGSGTKYYQSVIKNECFVVDSRPGHSQKKNIK